MAGAALAFVGGALYAGPHPRVTPFSSARANAPIPPAWSSLSFRNIERHTTYALHDEDGVTVLRAHAVASASGLSHAGDFDPQPTGRLRWRWKTNELVPRSDLAQAATDDCALRLQVSFKLDRNALSVAERARIALAQVLYGIDLPHSALVYVWDRSAPLEAVIPSPHTDRARAIVVESGTQHLGQWRSYTRDVRADYRKAFGSEPPRIAAITVMTDTDDTGATVTAYYGDIHLDHGSADAVPVPAGAGR